MDAVAALLPREFPANPRKTGVENRSQSKVYVNKSDAFQAIGGSYASGEAAGEAGGEAVKNAVETATGVVYGFVKGFLSAL